MKSSNSNLPSQNIKVSFIRLQDMPEYSNLSNLMTCRLCDTIEVIFPDYNSSGTFKIVKTDWNVLRDRYDEIELGELSTTLSEALGISSNPENTLHDPEFMIETVTVASGTIAAGAAENLNASVTKSGYTAIGIVGVQKSGQSYGTVSISRFYTDGTLAYVSIYNNYSSARTYTVSVDVLYQKA